MATTWTAGNPIPNPSNTWSDDPVVADLTIVKKQHLAELREVLELNDGHYHMFDGYVSDPELPDVSVSWSDPTSSIAPNVTKVRAQHWTELRDAVGDADNHYHYIPDIGYNSTTLDLGVPGTWSAGMVAGSKPKKEHIDELRSCLSHLHNHTHTACCDSECSCDGNNPCPCEMVCENICWAFD